MGGAPAEGDGCLLPLDEQQNLLHTKSTIRAARTDPQTIAIFSRVFMGSDKPVAAVLYTVSARRETFGMLETA